MGRRIMAYFDDDVYEKLCAEASRLGISTAAMIRMIVNPRYRTEAPLEITLEKPLEALPKKNKIPKL